jgi:hypothetical protein
MTLYRICGAICLAGLLVFPPIALSDDHGQSGDSSGASSSSGKGSDDQGGQGQDDKGKDNNNNGTTDDHGADNGRADDRGGLQKSQVNLAALPAGNNLAAEGKADIRVFGKQQRLKIEVEANVPDGTIFNVAVNGLQAGMITIRLGEGEFEFETEDGGTLPGGLLPSGIQSIVVSDSLGRPVLQAQFGSISSQGQSTAPPALVRSVHPLQPTPAAAPIVSEAFVDMRTQGAFQSLKVEVEAKISDGTVWTVFADNGIAIGTLRFRLQQAELHLQTGDTLPAGINSLGAIRSLQVRDAAGNVMLSATL